MTRRGTSALMLTAQLGDLRAMKILLKTGKINIELNNVDHETALTAAVKSGHNDAAILLILYGANPFKRDYLDKTAFFYAADKSLRELIKPILFSEHCNDENLAIRFCGKTIFNYADDKFVGEVDSAFRYGPCLAHIDHMDQKIYYGTTAMCNLYPKVFGDKDTLLMKIIEVCSDKTAIVLMDQVEVNSLVNVPNLRLSPLMLAILRNMPLTVNFLLKAGASTSYRNILGETPLSHAKKIGNEAIIKILKKCNEKIIECSK